MGQSYYFTIQGRVFIASGVVLFLTYQTKVCQKAYQLIIINKYLNSWFEVKEEIKEGTTQESNSAPGGLVGWVSGGIR